MFTDLLQHPTLQDHQITNQHNAYKSGFKINIVLLTFLFTLIHSEGNFGESLSFSQLFDLDVCAYVWNKLSRTDIYSNRRESEKKHTSNEYRK